MKDVNSTMDESLANLAMELRALKNRRKILKAVLDDLDARINKAEAQIEEKMVATGLASFVSNNAEFSIKETLSTSIIKDRLPDLIHAAKANGCGDLVKTSINTNTLSAYVRQYATANAGLIPDWVDGLVNLKVKMQIIIKEIK